MPIVLPTATFDPTKTIFGSRVYAVFSPTVGTPFTILAKVADAVYKQSTVEAQFPGTDGTLRPQRSCMKDAEERFELVDMEDVDSVLLNFGGLTGRHITGTCVLWICEQDDPTGTSVREKSNAFKCAASVKAGTLKFGGGDFSKITISILSIDPAPVVFTPNATA